MSQVLKELSELSQLESGEATFNRGTVNFASILSESIARLPELPGRAVTVSLIADGALPVHGDAIRLRDAFSAILLALRRELVTSDELVVRAEAREEDNVATVCIVIGARRSDRGALASGPIRPAARSTSGGEATGSACRRRGGSSRRMAVVCGAFPSQRRRKPKPRR